MSLHAFGGTVVLKVGSFVSIECEDEPGTFTRALVKVANSEGYLKLIYQDRYHAGLSARELREYMCDNGLNQIMLADALGISRTTVNRYLTGKRKIPSKVFCKLGIVYGGSQLQTQSHMEKLTQAVSAFESALKQLQQLTKEQ